MSVCAKKNTILSSFQKLNNSNQINGTNSTQDSNSKSRENLDEIKKARVLEKGTTLNSKKKGKIDQFFKINRAKVQKKTQQKKQYNQNDMNQMVYENMLLKMKLEEINADEQKMYDRQKQLLRSLMMENIRLKQEQNKYIISYQNESLFDQIQTKKKNHMKITKDLQQNKFSNIQKLFMQTQQKKLKNQISIDQIILEKYKKTKKLAFFQANCTLNFFKEKWPLLHQKYQPFQLSYQSQQAQFYKALNINTLEYVAIKLYKLKSTNMERYRMTKQQIEKQYELQAKLNHQNILKILDKFQISNDKICLVYQWSTHSLDELKNIKESQIIQIFKMIGDGLLYLHSNNIIHLNLKPNNILIVNGTVKISDFKYAANFDENTLMRLKYKYGDKLLPPQYINISISKPLNKKFDIWNYGYLLLNFFNQNQKGLNARELCLSLLKTSRMRQFVLNSLCDGATRQSIQKLVNILNSC